GGAAGISVSAAEGECACAHLGQRAACARNDAVKAGARVVGADGKLVAAQEHRAGVTLERADGYSRRIMSADVEGAAIQHDARGAASRRIKQEVDRLKAEQGIGR